MTFKRCLQLLDDEGRFAPRFDEGALTTIAADTVVFAIGQVHDLSFIDPDGDIELDANGRIVWEPETQQSSAADVFLAGDIAYGTRLLIDAVASGKSCARQVHARLSGEQLEEQTSSSHRELPDYYREQGYEKLARTPIPIVDVEQRRSSQETMVELGFDEQEALREAERCLDCGVNPIFDSERCILCGGCADVCPELCLELVSADRLTGQADLAPLLEQCFGDEDLVGMSAIVIEQERCIRCGLCAERCPVDAITMERFEFSSPCHPASAGVTS